MAQDPVAFTSEGGVSPEWTQQINNRDVLTSQIAAYFLPGEKLKPEVKCLATECVLKRRTHNVDIKDKNKVEVNPMMLCFFCDRTFHTACYDLDSHLIRVEAVPWKCEDCKRDLLNKHCQDYYRRTQYKEDLINRRAKLLLPTCLPETKESLQGSIELSSTDIKSFERRAIEVMAEDDPESIKDITQITPLLLKQVMKDKSDKKASIESANRYRHELEIKIRELEQLKLAISQQQQNRDSRESQEQQSSHDVSVSTSTHLSPSFSGAHHSSTYHPVGSNRTSNSLVGHYLEHERTSELETSTYQYCPEDISRGDNSNGINSNRVTASHSTRLAVDQSDLATLVSRLALQNDRKEERKLLDERRKAMPKMIEFCGEESKWLNFKRDVERYRKNCQYDDETVKTYMRGALKGEAFLIVRDIIEDAPIDEIMEHLKRAFGDEMRMVRNRSEDLRNLKFGPVLYKSEAVKLQVAIQSYFAACNYANIGYINTNVIAEALFEQFSIEDRQRCREFYERKNPGCTTIVMNVQTIYNYLMSRMPLLDEAPVKKKLADTELRSRSFQMQSTGYSSQTNEGYKFEIKDIEKAPYIGYKLEKVASLNKECEICHSHEHFTVECSEYQDKSERDRFRFLLENSLCKNCVLTTSHRAIDCDMKLSCGFKIDKSIRCCGKHHISIHRAEIESRRLSRGKESYRRRSNSRKNSTDTEASNEDNSSDSALSDRTSSDEEEEITAISAAPEE